MAQIYRSDRRIVRCSLCGQVIAAGEEYWCCNGTVTCVRCLPELARQELLSCREVRGKERRL